LLTTHINVQLRSLIKTKEPWDAMELLQERFRPSGAAKIMELKSKLETLQPLNKKNVHPYDQTLRYFESVDKIIEERYQVDGSTFTDDDLRLASWSALKHAENEEIRTIAR